MTQASKKNAHQKIYICCASYIKTLILLTLPTYILKNRVWFLLKNNMFKFPKFTNKSLPYTKICNTNKKDGLTLKNFPGLI